MASRGIPWPWLIIADLQLQYTTYKNTLQQIAQKIGDVEQEAEEHKSVFSFLLDVVLAQMQNYAAPLTPLSCLSHRSSLWNRLVLDTLTPLEGDRKCFRMINGVLVERTVKDVVPALQTNAEGLKKVLDDLVKQYKTKQDELEKWKVCLFCRVPRCISNPAQKKNNVQVVQS